MTLILGCVDFGRVAYAYCALSNASRTGAEYGATHGFTPYTRASWLTLVDQSVAAEMAGVPDFDASELHVDVSTAADSYGLFRVTVEVSYPFTMIVSWPGLPQRVLLWNSTSMRQIR